MIEKVLAYIDTMDTPENIVVWDIYANKIDGTTLALADGIKDPKSDCAKMLRGFSFPRVEMAAYYRISLLTTLRMDIQENG